MDTDQNKQEQVIDINSEEPDTANPEEKPEGESISSHINQETALKLIEMGFSKNASEKACFMNQSILEKAVDWIYEHMNDPDFEEELRIVGQNEKVGPKRTPEEAKQIAKEIQDKARQRYIEKERLLAEEQERSRIRQTKDLMRAKRDLEEAEIKRVIEAKQREKKEAEIEKQKMLEQLARDKEERFGKKFNPNTQQAMKKEYTPFENADYFLKTIKTLYPSFRNGDKAKICFNTLRVVLSNIVKNPDEDKYRKVKMTNPNVQEKIGSIPLAIKFLDCLSFKEEGEFMVSQAPDLDLYSKVIALLEDILKTYN